MDSLIKQPFFVDSPIFARVVHSPPKPAKIHLLLKLSPPSDKKDAKMQVFSSVRLLSGICLEFTCVFAVISSTAAEGQKIHV
ncbi:hypothetical protein [Cohnella hashimotonis]|uniref:Uncharacterized protein n=1 Tax=Cohnella hashimotonis TaxID=2826895 RepID=A0ABT6TFM9_9BACL|nr:hypothetical protein [Cohnella hashimotonis]MDI4645554.1 hypothetical protein [Cohnella hashimotonis]